MTPPGIDPGTVRLVAQRLNLYATPASLLCYTNTYCACDRLAAVSVFRLLVTKAQWDWMP